MDYNSGKRTNGRISNYVQTVILKQAVLLYTFDIDDCVLTSLASGIGESLDTMASNARESIDTVASNYLANADGELDW